MWDLELKEVGGLKWRWLKSGAFEITWEANKMGRGLWIYAQNFIPIFKSQCEGAGRGGGADDVEGGKVTGVRREEEEVMKTSQCCSQVKKTGVKKGPSGLGRGVQR